MEVFDEAREERYEEMQERIDERLDQAVENGRISEAQKDAILDKLDEMHDKGQELKGLSVEERRKAIIEFRKELRDWAEENDIDLDLLPRFGPGNGGRGGIGAGGCFGPGGHGSMMNSGIQG